MNKSSKKTLILCYEYEGEESRNANAICMYNLLSHVEDKSNFSVITSIAGKPEKYFIDDICIYNLNKNSQYNNSVHIKEVLNIFKDDAVDFINDLAKHKHFDNLVCVGFPYIILEIGKEVKLTNPKISLIIYQLDPYAFNSLLRFPKLLFTYRWIKERKVFESANKIFLTDQLYNLYSNNIYKRFKSKFVKLGIPMLSIHSDNYVKNTGSDNKIVYTGALSKKFRDPTFMLKLFCMIKDEDWTLHIYGADRSALDEQYVNLLGNKLVIHDAVPRSDIPNILKEASFLINISNVTTIQLPSKILDYIGFRKPIINLTTVKNDICEQLLERYPVKLLIMENTENEKFLAGKLQLFIQQYNNHICDKNIIEANYKEFTVKRIYEKFIVEL
ncbi:glycosyltransferase [Kaistella yonginensis]|jgi:hypothetical protein|uniref:glycosyltransferase n=1 Tax=Kaistella yonginensis TaxID=658267 RepID=UPI0025B5760B|nr:glycosyltransferase [Kaistella yonginensis]MDN3607576.1 hypothetical protein [Kaistella yonginensis]